MRGSYARYIGRRVVVQVGQDTLGGTLHEAYRDRVVLTDAVVMDNRPVPMDGEVVVPTAGIRWVQVP